MAKPTKRTFKSKQRVAGGSKNFRPWKDWVEGDLVVGKRVGTHLDQYDKECIIIKVEDAQWDDQDEADAIIGKEMVLNHAGQLNKAFDKIDEDEMVQVIYTGTAEMAKGKYKGNDSHTFEIDVVEEDDGSEEMDQEDTEDEETGDDEEEFDL